MALTQDHAFSQALLDQQRVLAAFGEVALETDDLNTAAMHGRLPRGIGVTRLIDAPIEWSRQWHMLGLGH